MENDGNPSSRRSLGGRFRGVYIGESAHGLLAPSIDSGRCVPEGIALASGNAKKTVWQLAEQMGEETTPDGVQRLLNAGDWGCRFGS